MKTISSTSITSTSGVTLISESAPRRPRPDRAVAGSAAGREGVVGGERHGSGPLRRPPLDGRREVVGEAFEPAANLPASVEKAL
jgi:hypothetical protein